MADARNNSAKTRELKAAAAAAEEELNASDEGAADNAPVDADVVENPEPEVLETGESTPEEAPQPTDGAPAAPIHVQVPEHLVPEDEYDYDEYARQTEVHTPEVSLSREV